MVQTECRRTCSYAEVQPIFAIFCKGTKKMNLVSFFDSLVMMSCRGISFGIFGRLFWRGVLF